MTTIEEPPRRWDPVVRLTHWLMAAAIIGNAFIVEEGSRPHIWVGYGLAAVLALRLLWGVIGPAEARFSAFPPSPQRALAHIGDITAGRRYGHASHNPLGALMVYAIWATLALVIGSGIVMAGLPPLPGTTAPQVVSGAAAETAGDDDERDEKGGEAGSESDGIAEELHEAAVNLLYALILLHIAGVIFETRRSGRQIVMAMLPMRR